MHPLMWFVMAALVAAFVYFSTGTWRLFKRREQAKPLAEYAVMALGCVLVGWHDVTWLRTNHPDASPVRYFGVWLELAITSGITALMLLNLWIAKAQSFSK